MFLMSDLALGLSCLLLVRPSLLFGFDTSFGSLESLSFDQLSVTLFLVSFLLSLHNCELFFLKDLHAGLLQGLKAQDIKHGLNFSVKVEKFSISVEDLSCLAVLLSRHLGLKEGYRGPVQIELGCDSDLLSGRLVGQDLDVLISLDEKMLASVNGLWRRDVSVGVDGDYALGSLENKVSVGEIMSWLTLVDLNVCLRML